MSETSETEHAAGGFLGLIIMIVAIILGGVVGATFGYDMWKYSGGPQHKLEGLDLALEHKKEALENAKKTNNQAMIKRYEDQIPRISDAEKETKQLVDEVKKEKDSGLAQTYFYSFKLLQFLGDLFLQMLKMIVVPLVVTSMICGITALGDVRKIGKIGLGTVIFYTITTAIAVTIGILLVTAIQPGGQADDTFSFMNQEIRSKTEPKDTIDIVIDVVRGRDGEAGSGMFPSNLIKAASDTNVLGLIVFSLVFGGVLTTIGKQGQVVIDFIDAVNAVIMKIVHLIMLYAPIGIFGLVAANIAQNGGASGFYGQLERLGYFIVTVAVGLGTHGVALSFILLLVARRNPITYLLGILRALLTAFSTDSSSATLPITMECVEENNGVSNRSASFVLPLGATINMDGTALYEATAAIFIAQLYGIDLSMGHLIVIFLTATLAAVGAAGIPHAGLVTLVIVLKAVDLPVEGIGAILAIDWFLDRLRTMVNVYGDSVGAAVIDRIFPPSPGE